MEENSPIFDGNNQPPVIDGINPQPNGEKSKRIVVIILIFFTFLLISFVGYKVLINYFITRQYSEIPFTNDFPPDSTREVVVYLDNFKEILIENPPIGNKENGYKLGRTVQDGETWEEDIDGVGSTKYYVRYYKNYKDFFGERLLGTVNVDGKTYEYISKVDGNEKTGSGSGSVWSKEDTVDANGYKGYRIIGYYNPMESETEPSTGDFRGIDNSSGKYISTAIVLEEIFSGVSGVLEFGYFASGDSDCTTFPADFQLVLRNTIVDYEK